MSELNETEKELTKKIGENNLEEVKQLLNSGSVKIDCCDENGMTPLQHSSYRGSYDICKYLLESGADVNSNHHIHGYSALMFAALGGHKNVVNLLLEWGANVSAVNSVGRNASQMAAFVGQHSTVSIINNFIAREQIELYTKPNSISGEQRLQTSLVSPLHLFVRQTNIHPIRIAMFLIANPIIVENGNKIIKVLDSMCEKQFKSSEPNEMIALKLHHLSFVLSQILKQLNISATDSVSDIGNSNEKRQQCVKDLEKLIKNWLKVRESDGFPLYLEKLLRQSIREFPYHESPLFQQLVRTLANVEIGEEPSALTILSQAISGQKGFDEDCAVCGTCGEPNPSKRCSKCKSVTYCNQDCQRLHWLSHKKVCKISDTYNKSELT